MWTGTKSISKSPLQYPRRKSMGKSQQNLWMVKKTGYRWKGTCLAQVHMHFCLCASLKIWKAIELHVHAPQISYNKIPAQHLLNFQDKGYNQLLKDCYNVLKLLWVVELGPPVLFFPVAILCNKLISIITISWATSRCSAYELKTARILRTDQGIMCHGYRLKGSNKNGSNAMRCGRSGMYPFAPQVNIVLLTFSRDIFLCFLHWDWHMKECGQSLSAHKGLY